MGSISKPKEIELIHKVQEYADVIYQKYTYNCVDINFVQRLCSLNEGAIPEEVYIVGGRYGLLRVNHRHHIV